MEPDRAVAPTRAQLARLMQVWRSAGWPCRDALELDLVAAGWVASSVDAAGRETLRVTDDGVRLLAESRRRNRRALSLHDRLGHRVARQLAEGGRIVWRELSLRAWVPADAAAGAGTGATAAASAAAATLPLPLLAMEPEPAPASAAAAAGSWRLARPDVFSVRHTSVEAYLHPVVHEIKTSRADLLSDLRHDAKRLAYQGLCCECYYVFPAGVAQLDEIPAGLGVWLLHGDLETGTLEFARPARHVACRLPFAAWLALARAVPWPGAQIVTDVTNGGAGAGAAAGGDDDDEPRQHALGAPPR
jgi:hypothetical protein